MNPGKWLVVIILDILILVAIFFIAFNLFIIFSLFYESAKGVELELAGLGFAICPIYILFSLAAIRVFVKLRSMVLQVGLDPRFNLVWKVVLILNFLFIAIFILIPFLLVWADYLLENATGH
jgi:hypothetical protein